MPFPSNASTRSSTADAARLEAMPSHGIVMHPGPMNRGVEISADVADSRGVSSLTRWRRVWRSEWPSCTCCWGVPTVALLLKADGSSTRLRESTAYLT